MRPFVALAPIAFAVLTPMLARAQEVPVGVEYDQYADTDPSAVTEFQQPLAGHGEWIDDPNYGTIWVPSVAEVGPEFAPYETGGHWVWDEAEGNVWVSDYAWGWAPFHYGRWVLVEGRGWSWIAGRAYGGAWVNWYLGPDGYAYVGWAPMTPSWIWRGGAAVWIGPTEPRAAYYCGSADLYSPRVGDHVVSGDAAAAVAQPMHPYVPAQPSVGRPVAPSRGPSPRVLAVDASRVPRPSPNDFGLTHARAYARPATAVSLGARPPVPHVVHVAASRVSVSMPSAPRVATPIHRGRR